MKRFFGTAFLVCAAVVFLSAQQVTVSEAIDLQDDIAYDILGEWSGQFLLLRDQSVKFPVYGFNQQMEQVWEKELELDRRRPQIIDVINEKRGFSIAYTYRDDLKSHLKLHRYDPAANLVDSATVATVGEAFFPAPLNSLVSEDRSKLLLYKLEQFQDIHLYSIDLDSLTLLWELVLTPDNLVFDRDFQQMLVDNDGNMFCILNKDNRRIVASNHHYEIFSYGPSLGFQLQRFEILMGDKNTFDVRFAFDNLNQQLVAGGLYADENLSRASGSFYLRFPLANPNDGILEFRELDDTFALTFMGKNFNAKNKGISETVVREIVLRKDGGILMIGERERVYQRNLSGGRYDIAGGRYVTDYYLDDLFIISYNPDGSAHWENVFHKKQFSQDDDAMYSSYLLVKTPSNLRLLYNDEISHENTVSEYVITATGQSDRNSVLSTDSKKLRLRFRDAIQMAANEVIVPSERRGKLKLVRISF